MSPLSPLVNVLVSVARSATESLKVFRAPPFASQIGNHAAALSVTWAAVRVGWLMISPWAKTIEGKRASSATSRFIFGPEGGTARI